LLLIKQAKKLFGELNKAEETTITDIELARLYSKQYREEDFVNSISEAKKILEQYDSDTKKSFSSSREGFIPCKRWSQSCCNEQQQDVRLL
jgi:hypothetical protein